MYADTTQSVRQKAGHPARAHAQDARILRHVARGALPAVRHARRRTCRSLARHARRLQALRLGARAAAIRRAPLRVPQEDLGGVGARHDELVELHAEALQARLHRVQAGHLEGCGARTAPPPSTAPPRISLTAQARLHAALRMPQNHVLQAFTAPGREIVSSQCVRRCIACSWTPTRMSGMSAAAAGAGRPVSTQPGDRSLL